MGALKTERGAQLRAGEVERARCAWLLASDLAAKAMGADVRVVMQTRGGVGRGGDDKTSQARKIACYLATVVADVTGARLADANGMDRASIFTAAQWVEDKREDGEFDTMMERLANTLVAMATRVVIAHLTSKGVDLGQAA